MAARLRLVDVHQANVPRAAIGDKIGDQPRCEHHAARADENNLLAINLSEMVKDTVQHSPGQPPLRQSAQELRRAGSGSFSRTRIGIVWVNWRTVTTRRREGDRSAAWGRSAETARCVRSTQLTAGRAMSVRRAWRTWHDLGVGQDVQEGPQPVRLEG